MDSRFRLPIGAIVLIIVCASIYFGTSDPDPTYVRYDYDIEVVDSFETTLGYDYPAPIGKQYAVVTWTVANDSFEDGFSTSDLDFQADVVVDGLAYTPRVIGDLHPGHLDARITTGHQATFVYVYEIPAGTDAEDIDVSFEYVTVYPPVMTRDEGI